MQITLSTQNFIHGLPPRGSWCSELYFEFHALKCEKGVCASKRQTTHLKSRCGNAISLHYHTPQYIMLFFTMSYTKNHPERHSGECFIWMQCRWRRKLKCSLLQFWAIIESAFHSHSSFKSTVWQCSIRWQCHFMLDKRLWDGNLSNCLIIHELFWL